MINDKCIISNKANFKLHEMKEKNGGQTKRNHKRADKNKQIYQQHQQLSEISCIKIIYSSKDHKNTAEKTKQQHVFRFHIRIAFNI